MKPTAKQFALLDKVRRSTDGYVTAKYLSAAERSMADRLQQKGWLGLVFGGTVGFMLTLKGERAMSVFRGLTHVCTNENCVGKMQQRHPEHPVGQPIPCSCCNVPMRDFRVE